MKTEKWSIEPSAATGVNFPGTFGLFSLLLLLLVSAICGASTITEISAEAQLNINTADSQDHAVVAMNADGLFLVVWHTETPDNNQDIRARYLGGEGSSFEIPVNYPEVEDNQRVPDVATNRRHSFLIVWSSRVPEGFNVMARQFNTATSKVGPEFQVNDMPSTKRIWPSAAMFDNGDFIVIWEQLEELEIVLYAQLFTARGDRIGEHMQVNRVPSCYHDGVGQAVPDIAVQKVAGRTLAVAAWSRNDSNSRSTVAVRRFNPYTRVFGNEIEVNRSLPDEFAQKRPMVDINKNGDFVVAWVETAQAVAASVHAVKYHGEAHPQVEDVIYSFPGNDLYPQNRISPKLFDSGACAFTWERNYGAPDHSDIVLMLFDDGGDPLIPEPYVVTSEPGTRGFAQTRPALDYRLIPGGIRVVVTWESDGQDGDGLGVYGKLLHISP